MRQSQSYWRKLRSSDRSVDLDSYEAFRSGLAWRIMLKSNGKIRSLDAWQIAAIPSFFLWIFRNPVSFFKKRKVAKSISRKMKSNSNPRSVE